MTHREHDGGLIPAHAGKTQAVTIQAQGHGAHPRSRGENGYFAFRVWPVLGSSPLTRGKHHRSQRGLSPAGLIPAHAGKTRIGTRIRGMAWAHPRSRGENPRLIGAGAAPAGSSPLTRGKPMSASRWRARLGLIPAHAGKTAIFCAILGLSRAHPRSRGENRSGNGEHAC